VLKFKQARRVRGDGGELQTVDVANFTALKSMVLAVRGTCKRFSEEERGEMLKLKGNER